MNHTTYEYFVIVLTHLVR